MPTPASSRLGSAAKSDRAAAERALQKALRHALVPHAGGQQEVMADDSRFQILTAGRRWGKTKLAARKIIKRALSNPDSLNWWVANYYQNTRRGYREVVRQLPPDLLAKPAPSSTANELRLQLKTGAVIEFYSGANPDALAGAGVDFMVVDEAALIDERVWFQLLRPTLMDTGGGALVISTPRGRNWFWKLWQLGQRPQGDYASWRFTSYDNPYIDNAELDEAKETLPELFYRQEILAEFVDNAASIFDVEAAIILPVPVDPQGHVYLGVDLAKKEDFTVLCADREDGHTCYYDRFNEVSWGAQKRMIADAADYLMEHRTVTGVTIGVDSTGLGDVVFDDLVDMGYDVVGINFASGTNNRQKEHMVRRLAGDLQHQRTSIIEAMRDEFETYEYAITSGGRYKFEAAVGHDDKVSAKMLAHWVRHAEGVPTVGLMKAEDAGPGDEPENDTAPDTPESIMDRPEVWSSFAG